MIPLVPFVHSMYKEEPIKVGTLLGSWFGVRLGWFGPLFNQINILDNA